MRKILWLLLVLLGLVTGCSKGQSNMEKELPMNIKFEKGTFNNKNWNEEVGTYQQDVIPDEHIAIEVAIQIFNGMQKNSKVEKYVPQSVFYDEIDEVWIVSFWEENEDDQMLIVGDDCNIAMNKKDGQVLRIWFGE